MRVSVTKSAASKASTDTLQSVYSFPSLDAYTLRQRILIRVADITFYLLIKLIGRTVRFEVEGAEKWEAASANGHLPIYTFWHNCVFLATYFFRDRGIVVMTSQSFDGEYIARFIHRFGYGATRGSSTRGAVGALLELVRVTRQGRPGGFTIDGPKGPRHVAKMGAIMLAKKTGNPILPFAIAARRYWEVNSWDRFQVPYPFTKARVVFGDPIYVENEADEATVNKKQSELQQSLDEITRRGDNWRLDECKQ